MGMQKTDDLLVEYNICLADVPCPRHKMAWLLSCLWFRSNHTHCTQSNTLTEQTSSDDGYHYWYNLHLKAISAGKK